MLLAALQAEGPSVIIESNALVASRSTSADGPAVLEGAKRLSEGEDISLLAYGSTVSLAQSLAKRGETEGFVAEVIDLRSLRPLDMDTLGESVRKTGHCLFLHESEPLATRVLGAITDTAFHYLEAPPTSSQSEDLDALVDCIWEILDH